MLKRIVNSILNYLNKLRVKHNERMEKYSSTQQWK